MTTSEPGPELDRRVAELFGWTELRWRRREKPGLDGMLAVSEGYIGNPPNGSSPAPLIRWVPRYSTDPARIAEMVEWLRGRVDVNNSSFLIDPLRCTCSATLIEWDHVEKMFDVTRLSEEVYGQTIQHALALLVVAVGEVEQ